jgi:hypothetical protein
MTFVSSAVNFGASVAMSLAKCPSSERDRDGGNLTPRDKKGNWTKVLWTTEPLAELASSLL